MKRSGTARYRNLIETEWVDYCSNLNELLTGILLDTRTPVERVALTVSRLKNAGLLGFWEMQRFAKESDDPLGTITKVLKATGYIWYNQKAALFLQDLPFKTEFELSNANWQTIQTIKGIGPKLASLWVRIVHDETEIAIIDTHVKRWLRDVVGTQSNDYLELSRIVKEEALSRGMSLDELDRLIVENGQAKRLGLLVRDIPPRVMRK